MAVIKNNIQGLKEKNLVKIIWYPLKQSFITTKCDKYFIPSNHTSMVVDNSYERANKNIANIIENSFK